jgi:hypothetical protein
MTYWMIEHYNYNGPTGARWLRIAQTGSVNGIPRAELIWDENPINCLRFSRGEDAEHFALLHPDWCVLAKVTEHADVPSGVKEPTPARRFTGVGHLEQTGYIPAGSAAERDGNAGVQPTAKDHP